MAIPQRFATMTNVEGDVEPSLKPNYPFDFCKYIRNFWFNNRVRTEQKCWNVLQDTGGLQAARGLPEFALKRDLRKKTQSKKH